MWSICLLIMLDTLLLRLSLHFIQLHFTPLHYTCWHFTSSHLNFTQLHFTTLSFGLTPFKFPTAPFHLTSLRFTSLQFTALLDVLYEVKGEALYGDHVFPSKYDYYQWLNHLSDFHELQRRNSLWEGVDPSWVPLCCWKTVTNTWSFQSVILYQN
jgi:hypothetical protein